MQAATGAARHVAFQSLMTLQQQLALDTAETSEEQEAFNARLARVISKLFARVIKAEESMAEPYDLDAFDIEATLCSMEDFLCACCDAEQRAESTPIIAVCHDLMAQLTSSLLQSHSYTTLLALIEDLGIDTASSRLAVLIADPGESDKAQKVATTASRVAVSEVAQPSSSKGVGPLVAALGSAKDLPEREAALAALREYMDLHGNDELEAHLQEVSSPFRSYIEDQLATAPATSPSDSDRETATAMSARLRSIRSRLEATELAVKSAVQEPASEPMSPTRIESPAKPASPARRVSRLSQPTPSKLVPPSQSKLPLQSSSQTLRERLAASRPTSAPDTSAGSAVSSMNRAAALRARLEAVKQKNKAYD